MKVQGSHPKQFIDSIITRYFRGSLGSKMMRKIIMLNLISIIGIVFILSFGCVAFYQSIFGLGCADFTAAILLVLNLYYFWKSKHYQLASHIGIFMAGTFFLYLFVSGGAFKTGPLWYYTFPLFACYLLGSKRGAIASLTLIGISILLLYINRDAAFFATYQKNFLLRFFPSFFVVFAYSYLYEYMTEKNQEELRLMNSRLDRKVAEQTIELNAKNISLSLKIEQYKTAQDALRKSEERFRDLADLLPQTVFELNDSGHITFANRMAFNTFGYTQEDFDKGLNALQIFVSEDRDKIMAYIQRVLSGEIIMHIESTAQKKNGSTFPVLVYPRVILHKDIPVGIRGILIDITAQKKAEENRRKIEAQLQNAQRMEALGILAGGVAHDLNNVLSGIVGYPDLLLMQIPEDSALRSPILAIQDSGIKAANIVQDLLTLARRGVTSKEVMNLNNIISEYLKSPEYNKLKSYHSAVELETYFETDLLNFNGSHIHVFQTVMNLVSNAAEAMPDGGEITISTQNQSVDSPLYGFENVDKGDYVVLKVSDTGMGISSEDMDRIFEPFYTKKVMGRSGTGLGMAVVWGTIKDHSGFIDVQSSEGKGTELTLYFPAIKQKKPKEKALLPIQDYMGKGESILVVDDVKEQRNVVSAMLTQLGYISHNVPSGEEAVEFLKKHTVDLIILDMIMDPGMDGLDTYKQILELHPGQKAIISSGFSETERVKEAQRLGIGKYLKKPYTLEKLGIALKEEFES